MAIKDESAVAKALNSLFPSKRYAPHKGADTGCPTPPEGWDKEDNTESGA